MQLLLGIQIDYDFKKHILQMSQTRYISESLVRYGILDTKQYKTPLSSGIKLSKDDCPTTPEDILAMKQYPYQSLIGILMYAMLVTHPDIAFAVGILSQFSLNPGKVYWNQACHILGYLSDSRDLCLEFDGNSDDDLDSLILGYSDSDWAGDVDTR